MLRPLNQKEKDIYHYLLSAVNQVMTHKEMQVPNNNLNWYDIIRYAEFCSISNILGYGVSSFPKDYQIPPKAMDALIYDKKYYLMKDANQFVEMQKFQKLFVDNGIDYIMLKGFFIKSFYEQSDYRQCADLDFYCRQSDFDKIIKLSKQLGFSISSENERVITIVKEPFACIEIHSHIDFINTIFTKSLFEYATLVSPHHYELSNEDHYVYIVEHMAKHFSGLGGVGIKSMIDIHILSKKLRPSLDKKYLRKCFEKSGLVDFEHKMIEKSNKLLLKYQFEFDMLDDFILSSGTFGTEDTYEVNKRRYYDEQYTVNENNRFAYMLYRAFPPKKRMMEIYPNHKHYSLILPFLWIDKLFHMLCGTKRKAYRKNALKCFNSTNEQLNTCIAIMKSAGL